MWVAIKLPQRIRSVFFMLIYSCSRVSAGANIDFGIRCLALLQYKVG
jgi:hypothetical protein